MALETYCTFFEMFQSFFEQLWTEQLKKAGCRYVASYPLQNLDLICGLIEKVFQVPTLPLNNFLSLNLVSSHQVLTLGRLHSLFRNWDGKTSFPRDSLPKGLWEGITKEDVRSIERLDEDYQAIRVRLLDFGFEFLGSIGFCGRATRSE